MKKLSLSISSLFVGLLSLVLSSGSFAFDTTAAEAQIATALTSATTIAVAMLGIGVVLGAIRMVRAKAT